MPNHSSLAFNHYINFSTIHIEPWTNIKNFIVNPYIIFILLVFLGLAIVVQKLFMEKYK